MSEIDVGVGYRKLDPSEKVLEGDEFHDGLRWRPSYNWKPESGGTQADDQPYRRPVPAESFPPLSPEAKDAMTQDGKGMMELVDAIPEATAGERIYTMDEVKAAQAPPFRMLTIGDTVSRGDEVYHKGKWRPVPPRHIGWVLKGIREPRRRKTAAGHVADLNTFAGTTSFDLGSVDKSAEVLVQISEAMDAKVMESHLLKPFTPNKYTRWMPTLDGRKVPVDVYCVLAAFPTGSSAVDHAVKKELAPGVRGVKSRLQDLKEARDSLTRAIELEEAADAL